MNNDEDTDWWLGSPTPLEMCQQHARLLENEIQELTLHLRKAREDICGLVQMHAEAAAAKTLAEAELKKAMTQIANLNWESADRANKLRGLILVADQRDYLFRENQRLLLERRQEKSP